MISRYSGIDSQFSGCDGNEKFQLGNKKIHGKRGTFTKLKDRGS